MVIRVRVAFEGSAKECTLSKKNDIAEKSRTLLPRQSYYLLLLGD